MIESIENVIQLAVMGVCAVIAFSWAASERKRAWLQLGFFYGVYFLGELYWVLYLMFYKNTPSDTFIPYLSWYASYLFLWLLLQHLHAADQWKKHIHKLWWTLIFPAGMCIFYMRFGAFISNLTAAFLMTMLIWTALIGLISHNDRQDMLSDGYDAGYTAGVQAGKRCLYLLVLLFCLIEYAVWTVSCFEGKIFLTLYYIFDAFLIIAAVLFIPAVRKAADK